MVLMAPQNIVVKVGIGLFVRMSLFTPTIYGQEIEDLRNERLKQMQDIEYTEKLLQQTATNKKNKLGELNLISRKIRSRENVVSSLRGELNYLDRSIRNNEKEVVLLRKEIKGLKDDYANMIYKAFLTHNSYHKAQYIMASQDFNQAYKRLKYLQQYSQFRREQATLIQLKTLQLQEEVSSLELAKLKQKSLLTERQIEVANLNNEKDVQRKFVNDLSSKEKQLRRDLKAKKKIYDRIEDEINKLLKAAMKGGAGMLMTPEMKIVSEDFTQNKGRLPWPVERGVITEKFGKHKHPVLKKVSLDNPGVNIITEKGEAVRAVFKGTVKNVFTVPGANVAIIIQHGEYFTVYQGLVDVGVKKGDEVAIKQVLGKTFTEKGNNSSQLHFQVYKGTNKMDPELWLAK
jgi:murein DD-endopeptidase MepM/ murein hydrolase activator NlpD